MGRVQRGLRQVRRRDRPGSGKAEVHVGELEEEEQSLERLRRWHRDLLRRNISDSDAAAEARLRLDAVTAKLAEFSERVFAANLPGVDLG